MQGFYVFALTLCSLLWLYAANEAFEKIASYGLQPNMILYLIREYNFTAASGTSTLFIWGAISNFMPIFGAFLSDSYFGRFLVIAVATLTTLMVRLSSLSHL
ncbi:UNVERIFIED_CONTAM: protein NRT1/ PTR FAMILY 1.2 [Sesamum radiatum]|uniref:Protein NRT1/ PTR FAMILY 1.2 n=1 Tax=Sesamum radiatum TaxID=300843 RepID=A0AAW2KNX6_SESRA